MSSLLVAGPIEAWRFWVRGRNGEVLSLFHRDVPWQDDCWVLARCHPFKLDCMHWSPAYRTCGFYGFSHEHAVREFPALVGELAQPSWAPFLRAPGMSVLFGPVWLKGKVAQHEWGYRAEVAKVHHDQLIPVDLNMATLGGTGTAV